MRWERKQNKAPDGVSVGTELDKRREHNLGKHKHVFVLLQVGDKQGKDGAFNFLSQGTQPHPRPHPQNLAPGRYDRENRSGIWGSLVYIHDR